MGLELGGDRVDGGDRLLGLGGVDPGELVAEGEDLPPEGLVDDEPGVGVGVRARGGVDLQFGDGGG